MIPKHVNTALKLQEVDFLMHQEIMSWTADIILLAKLLVKLKGLDSWTKLSYTRKSFVVQV